MKIHNANYCLKFYKSEGWNIHYIRKLLINPRYFITDRKYYYAVYGTYPNKGDYKIFKKSEIDKNEIEDRMNFGNIEWYIKVDK
jgi:hypothetical protein